MDELVSFRTDKKLVKELKHLQEEERLDKSSAIRKVFELGLFEWKKEDVLRHLLTGRISLSKAAAMLGVPYDQILEILRERKMPFIDITKADIEEEAEAAKRG